MMRVLCCKGRVFCVLLVQEGLFFKSLPKSLHACSARHAVRVCECVNIAAFTGVAAYSAVAYGVPCLMHGTSYARIQRGKFFVVAAASDAVLLPQRLDGQELSAPRRRPALPGLRDDGAALPSVGRQHTLSRSIHLHVRSSPAFYSINTSSTCFCICRLTCSHRLTCSPEQRGGPELCFHGVAYSGVTYCGNPSPFDVVLITRSARARGQSVGSVSQQAL